MFRSNSRPSSLARRRFDDDRLRRAGLIALAAALLASMGIRTITLHLVDDSRSFAPLHATSVISLTAIGVLAAVFVCTELNKLVAAPVTVFRRVTPVALLLSFGPDIGIWIGHSNPGTRAATMIPLMLAQVAVALICVTVLPWLGVDSSTRIDSAEVSN